MLATPYDGLDARPCPVPADFAVTAARLSRVVAMSLISSGLVSAVMDQAYLVNLAAGLVPRAISIAFQFFDCDELDVRGDPVALICVPA